MSQKTFKMKTCDDAVKDITSGFVATGNPTRKSSRIISKVDNQLKTSTSYSIFKNVVDR